MASPRWPALIRPMLAVAGEVPTASGWAYEFKWDGVRTVAYVASGRMKLLSRNDRDVTAGYPELAVLPALLPNSAVVLDGEIVTLDNRGAPSFSELQRRMHVRSPSPALVASAPVQYIVFDLLHLDRPLTAEPWSQRRELLEGLDLERYPVQLSPAFTDDPGTLLETARRQRLEGLVSKRIDAFYFPGRRSPVWRKTALVQTTEVVIGGYKHGQGRRVGTVGSLLVGAFDRGGRLAYLGGVGTGFTGAMLADLGRLLKPLERNTSPFATEVPAIDAKGAVWVRPSLVGEVVYRTFTPDGRLRHCAWRGLRPDREPAEARLDRLTR